MKKRGSRVVTVVMFSLIMLLATIHLPKNTFAATSPRIYLEPSANIFYTNQTHVGDAFNVTAWVEGTPEMAAWQIYMEFNDDIINASRWFEPKWDPQYIFYGKTSLPFPAPPTIGDGFKHLSPGKARVEVTSALFPYPPDQPASSGNGILCILEFVIKSAPTSGELSCSLHIDSDDTNLLEDDPLNPGWGRPIEGVVKEDGSYSFTYTSPPPPYLAVSPAFIELRPLQGSATQPLSVDVLANDVSSVLDLKTVTFSLGYNQSILTTSESNVTLGSLWGGGSSVIVADGMVNITVTNPASTPNGNVVIGNVTFSIIRETSPPAPLGSNVNTTLDFDYHALYKSDGNEIQQDSPINGSVRIYAYYTQTTLLEITEPAVVGFGRLIIPNKEFQVNVTLGEVFDFSEANIYVTFNQSILNCTTVKTADEFAYTSLTSWEINNASGYLRAVVESSGKIPTVFSGPILTLTFAAEAEGTSFLNFSQPYGTDTSIYDSISTLIAVSYVERTVAVTSGNISNIVIGSLAIPMGSGIIDTANGSIMLKQQGPIFGSANVSFSMNDTEGLTITPNDFQVALNTTETYTQSLTFTNTGVSATKSIAVTVQINDATDGTLTDESSFIVTILAEGTETTTLKVTVKIRDTGVVVENANVTVSLGDSDFADVTDADGVVLFDLGVVTGGNVTVSVHETSSYYGDSVNITMHSGLNEYTLELVGKMTQTETDYTFFIIVAIIIIIVVAIAGVYLYKKRQLRLAEE